jgi:transposase
MFESEYLLQLETANATIVSKDQQITLLDAKVVSLEAKLALVLDLLQKTSVKKDSHNSSLPPSTDLFTSKTKSLRPPSVLKSGGQLGHDGTTLKMSATPDVIHELKNNFCTHCRASLAEADFILKAKRQVIEIPPIVPIYEEYRQYGCFCPHCRHEQIAQFPLGVNAPIQYGTTVETLISYLSVGQYVPFARLQSLLVQVFSLPLSQGTIGNILEKTALKCQGVYEKIKTQIAESQVVGSDETGAKVNGDKWWIWVWQNVFYTFIVAAKSRGAETIANIWADKLANVILVTDRWAAQLKDAKKGHQICLAHLLRNIIFLGESEKHTFATQFKQLMLDVFSIRKQLIQLNNPYQFDQKEAKIIEKRLNDLLIIDIDKDKYPLTRTFQNSMIKYRNYLFPCLYNLDIPPDNNGSERAIRNIKVKQKVSGQFKSGQNAFCIIRSIIDTLRKKGVPVLLYLNQIIKLQPE